MSKQRNKGCCRSRVSKISPMGHIQPMEPCQLAPDAAPRSHTWHTPHTGISHNPGLRPAVSDQIWGLGPGSCVQCGSWNRCHVLCSLTRADAMRRMQCLLPTSQGLMLHMQCLPLLDCCMFELLWDLCCLSQPVQDMCCMWQPRQLFWNLARMVYLNF